ncbi:AfsR/SARP family transcriptional regulator [Phytohabitans aurantiacus]|uniref:SARP family transcriptional regulator n=1 Tax=Phytohabitans aurantiacus TaxID=3016789 RepID=A0ABQ5R753_9ACTN|nr:AfsR/SARP family transcriptional regulator [Phytohabitans aurantiacus]GLI01401.1 SARP family transcriptional regulator [Phytohabitans aurantiacus]
MRFGVLGPLLVRDAEGAEVVLRSRHERTLLAVLLVRAGRVAPVERLVEALWPDRVPASHASNLQTYVSRLRDRLSDVSIEHRDGGYLLRVDADQLDLLVFRREVAAARAALAAGDAAGAVDRFRLGLAQWRGRPFADLPALEGIARTWEAERLDAVEDQVDAELTIGESLPEVVSRLHGLVAEHPLRERVHGQLMVALARAGRRAEALSAYQNARDVLVAELGVEPGSRLRDLHRAILRGDDPAPVAPAASRAWAPVCQLPPALPGFAGRDELLDQVAALLTAESGVPVVALSGQPGVGKSALAVVAAHRVRPAFPDGQLYAHLAGASAAPRDPDAVLADLLRSLGTPESAIPRGLPALTAAYRARLADRRVLVVLDDAADPEQVRSLVPGTPGSAVLVTSRWRLSGLIDARHAPVEPLTDAEAGQLLAYVVGADRVAGERVSAGRIAAACGNLPLALRIAGTRLATRPWRLRALADRLDDERRRLTELAAGDQQVRAALALSVRALSARARAAFALLGLVGPASFAAWAVAALLPGDPDPSVIRASLTSLERHQGRPDHAEAEAILDELVEASLVEPVAADGEPRYRMHDLLRIYADELAAADPRARTAARRRLLAAAVARADAAAARLPRTLTWYRPAGAPGGELEPFEWFDGELAFLTAALDVAADEPVSAVALAERLAPYLWARGRWAELRAVQRCARLAAERLGDDRAMARAEFLAAVLSLVCGDLPEAAAGFARSRGLFERLGDPHGVACVLSDEAVLHGLQGRHDDSAHAARRAVEVFRAEADPIAAVLASPALSAALRGLGRLDEALDADRTAVAEARAQGAAELVVARALNSLAVTRLVRGEALLGYQAAAEAVERLRGVGDRYVLLAALRHQASAAAGLGRRREAVRLLEESHDLAVELGDRLWATGLARDLAVSWIGDGRAAAAVPVLKRCLATYDEMNVRSAKAATLDMLARAYDALGDGVAARDARRGAGALSDGIDAGTPALSKIILSLAENVGARG